MLFPVSTLASREKSLCLSAVFSKTFSYTSRCLTQQPHPYQTQGLLTIFVLWINRKLHVTSLEGLLREKTLRGHFRWRCPEHQLRMFSHSTVLDGPGPSSRCSRINCFRARTAVFSSICSNWEGKNTGESKQNSLLLSSNRVWISSIWSYSNR